MHLVGHLEEQGDEVIQLERTVDGIDIADAEPLTDAVMAAKPEAVYHLAGASDVGGSWSSPARRSSPTPWARSTCWRPPGPPAPTGCWP